jgi:hypothetical protein
MPDPFLLIAGFIAIACVILFPIRMWRRRHHRYGDGPDEIEVDQAGADRR